MGVLSDALAQVNSATHDRHARISPVLVELSRHKFSEPRLGSHGAIGAACFSESETVATMSTSHRLETCKLLFLIWDFETKSHLGGIKPPQNWYVWWVPPCQASAVFSGMKSVMLIRGFILLFPSVMLVHLCGN